MSKTILSSSLAMSSLIRRIGRKLLMSAPPADMVETRSRLIKLSREEVEADEESSLNKSKGRRLFIAELVF